MSSHTSKVAVIEPVGGHGGMDYYDFGLCQGLAEAGVDVVLHTCDETALPENATFEVRHTYAGIYNAVSLWRRGLRFLHASIKAVVSAVLEGRSVCHFHFFHVGPLQVFTIALAKLFGRRVVITAHDVESLAETLEVPALSRWVYKKAHQVVAHNQISRKELIDRIGIHADHIAVIPHGNYLHALRPLPSVANARQSLGIHTSAKVVLFFGQIKEVKGLDLLIDAMAEVLKQHPEALLLIAGKPWKTDFSTFECQIERVGIREQCLTHIRFISDAELPNFYAAADVVALPYRRIYQSGVVLMAMSYAKAVVVSDLPGMTEIVTDGENGFVFDQGSVTSLVEKLNYVLSHSDVRKKTAEKGLQKVRLDYDWRSIGKQVSVICQKKML